MSNHSSIPLDSENNKNMEKEFSGLIKNQSSKLSQIMTQDATKQGFGETSAFPEGKINKDDEGEIQFGVTTKDEKVILNFGKPVAWLGMTPGQAEDLGRLLIHRAYEIGNKRR